jgi:DNA-binding transcriptional MerR regulator
MPTQHPIRVVARLTGIPVDTLRAWERRYQAVKPARVGRERLYGDGEIRRLLLLRSAVDSGHAIRHVAPLSDAALEELEGRAMELERRSIPERARVSQPRLETLLQAIADYDYGGLNEELGKLALMLSPTDLLYQVVLPLVQLTGENWQKGIFQTAQEHMVSACIRNLIGSMVRLKPSTGRKGGLLLTTPTSEQHEFGILAAAMLSVAHDLRVCYLGPNLPARDIVMAARQIKPQVVVLGVTKMNASPMVRHEIRLISYQLEPGTELWLGGTGAHDVATEGCQLRVMDDLYEFERALESLTPAAALS